MTDATAGGTWVSENTGIATVSGTGDVTGVAIGNVVISYVVSSGGCAAYAKAKVIVGNSIITTISGTGISGYTGDGGAATAARMNQPHGVKIDGAGNIYIDENGSHVIRRINSAGIISTIAGTGVAGFSGDGAAATSAQLNTPYEVALDAAGNLYIGDALNHGVRKVSTAGTITTVAGNGTAGGAGDGGAATAAQLNTPGGITFDADGNIYICEVFGHRVRKVTPAGIISTIAGNGIAGFSGDGVIATATRLNNPNYITISPAGNLIITDNANHRIRSINMTTGIISTIAGTGTAGYIGDNVAATSTRINFPGGITFDKAGNLYLQILGTSGYEWLTRPELLLPMQVQGSQDIQVITEFQQPPDSTDPLA